MTTDELLSIAFENLQDALDNVCQMAMDPAHLNIESKEMKAARELVDNRLLLCFTLKNAFNDVTSAAKEGETVPAVGSAAASVMTTEGGERVATEVGDPLGI